MSYTLRITLLLSFGDEKYGVYSGERYCRHSADHRSHSIFAGCRRRCVPLYGKILVRMMTRPREFSSLHRRVYEIEAVFRSVKAVSPVAAESLVVKLQKILREPDTTGKANIG